MNSGTLFIVATPIGNLDDFSTRGRNVLTAVSVIAAEDTRVTRKLLSTFGIKTPLLSLHEYNETGRSAELLSRLQKGEDIALVSDAGTPLISDPGFELVRACHQNGLSVTPVPGPSALIAALCIAGLPTDRFVFEGFLPNRQAARKTRLQQLNMEPRTLVFYESVHRLAESLQDMADCLGADRQVVLARELTKLYETVTADSLSNLAIQVATDANARKGEAVVIVAGNSEPRTTLHDLDTVLLPLLTDLPLKQAVKLAAAISGQPKNAVYARALELQKA
ncbi:MAG: 16S rRNA (cytidine(1402)-2'-O)-methyltransferase [Gammaproteobacteria bacterium]